MKKILLVYGLFLFLTACSDNTSLVKDGVMKFNKTLTVGQAFDNWQNCNNGEWSEFETSNGMVVVQFICDVKNTSEYFKKMKAFVSENLKEKSSLESLDIKSQELTFQWTINKDNTFQIHYIGENYEWNDGKKYTKTHEDFSYLEGAYNNDINWDLDFFNNQEAKTVFLNWNGPESALKEYNNLRNKAE